MPIEKPLYTFTDQLNRTITYPFPPKRIISVVPSQTELLFDLGLNEEIAGVTWFCIHPEKAKSKAKVGGTKNLKLEKIAELNPDLILANKEENVKSQIEWLSERFPVWISDIQTIDDAFSMMQSIGMMTGKEKEAHLIIQKINDSFALLKSGIPKRTLYLIWKDPYMSIGNNTFIHNILEKYGLVNVLSHESRYPKLTGDLIKALNPELVFLSSEPYPFKEKDVAELKAILPNADIRLVDGEMFSWYGSRLIKAGKYLKELFS